MNKQICQKPPISRMRVSDLNASTRSRVQLTRSQLTGWHAGCKPCEPSHSYGWFLSMLGNIPSCATRLDLRPSIMIDGIFPTYKALLFFLLVISLLSTTIVNAQPFGPPLYIADSVNMKCRYYFAGDQKHFNPRAENYTINIGYTTDFKSEAQACEFFRCTYTNGSVKVDENNKPIEKDLCVCPSNNYLDDVYGCVKFKQQEQINFLQLIWRWIIGIFK